MFESPAQEFLPVLQQATCFSGLDQAQLTSLAPYCESVRIKAHSRITREGVHGDYLYLLQSGRVLLTHTGRHGEEKVAFLEQGDYFGEESLLFNHPSTSSATTLNECSLLRIEYENFHAILASFPQLKRNFQATAESRRLASRVKFDWLGQDEIIYLIQRKHEIFLFQSLFLPILLVLLTIPIFIWGIFSRDLVGSNLALFGGGILFFLGLGIAVWNYVDWGNDYYIITNQRVIWLEKVVGLYYSRHEAPLSTILTVNITSSQPGRIVNYGSLEVRTFTGSIIMRNMANPGLFEIFLRSHRERAQHRLRESERREISNLVHTRLNPVETRPQATLKNTVSDNQKKPARVKKEPFLERCLRMFNLRSEQNGVITYRKHWLVLIQKTWLPTVLFLLLIAFTIYFFYRSEVQSQSFGTFGLWWSFWVVLGSIGLAAWWLYRYSDWSNDIYQLTAEEVVDIEKKPLGKEDKKSAALDAILSIEHTRKGIVQLLFNYGDVIISVGQTQFIFHGVFNPDQVHQDVNAFLEARKRKKREREIQQERERMLDWLSAYNREQN